MLVLTGTYGTIVSRVIYTEWMFFGALALGTLSLRRLGFHAFRDCRAYIQRPPSTYLREFYYDTVNFDQGALQLAIQFAGADHVLAGSDYPHQIGSIPSMLAAINKLPVTDDERAGILGLNAARLLGITMAW